MCTAPYSSSHTHTHMHALIAHTHTHTHVVRPYNGFRFSSRLCVCATLSVCSTTSASLSCTTLSYYSKAILKPQNWICAMCSILVGMCTPLAPLSTHSTERAAAATAVCLFVCHIFFFRSFCLRSLFCSMCVCVLLSSRRLLLLSLWVHTFTSVRNG